ncbi:MAG: tol-pal system protein YbgF [Deltaproteobacteria bacterium]|nr:tol-pal system protein YbgF [Deltaproteobacteria bacterium]
MRTVARTWFVVLSLVSAWGCTVDYHAAPAPAVQAQLTEGEWAVINGLKAEIGQARTQLADTRAEVTAMQNRLNAVEGNLQELRNGGGGASANAGEIGRRLAALESEVRAQRNLLKVREDELRLLRDAVLQGAPPRAPGAEPTVETPQAPAATEGAPQVARPAPRPATEAPTLQQDYENAWRRLRERDFRGAIEQFKKFVEKHPNSPLTDNAQYWIGESHYALQEFDEAILEFDVVRKNYPDGDKAPAAWLKIGYAFAELGNRVDARLILQEVINRYPNSEEAGKARERLQSLDA